ncbi:MAG TPA: hypothetical protein VGH47_04370 [Xanthobacteraceae bacterium]|jgi:hypothetical protein
MTQPYQLLPKPLGAPTQMILRVADNATIPSDPANRDFQEFLAWIEQGNEPDPAPVPNAK